MDYLATFIEGIATFISPCILPMLPLYLAYIAGSADTSGNEKGSGSFQPDRLVNAFGFVLGFTILFVLLGALAGTLGSLLTHYHVAVSVACGIIVVMFGLAFAGVLDIPFFNRTIKPEGKVAVKGFPTAVLFGFVFAIGWTPCVGAFLGSALLLAAQQATAVQGVTLLLCYSLGLGVPFLLSALLIDRLSAAFGFIKSHYSIITRVCGALLVIMGLVMIFSAVMPAGQTGTTQREQATSASDETGQQSSSAATQTPATTTQADIDTMSGVTLRDADGGVVPLDTFQGKPTLMFFWATWCPYCLQEIDAITKIYPEYADRINFVAVNAVGSNGETVDKAAAYFADNEIPFATYFDDGNFTLLQAYGVSGLPHSVAYDAAGNLVDQHAGAMTETSLRKALDNLL